jgi:acetyltransferase
MKPPTRFTLPDGTPMTVRKPEPHDAPALAELIGNLTPRDRRWRFHGTVNGVASKRLAQMVHPQAGHELVLLGIAHRDGRDTLVADARCALDETGRAAEFALMVSEGWQRLGIGGFMVEQLRTAAADRGWRWLYGSVLSDNTPMQSLMRRCGFLCTPHRSDAGLVMVEKLLEHDHDSGFLPWPPAHVALSSTCLH